MAHIDAPQFLGIIAIVLLAAKLCGALASKVGQPTVLGELIAGVLLGTSVLGIVDPHSEVLHLFAEIGLVILLFEIGLETDLRKLFRAGGTSAAVALAGVVVPFALGWGVGAILGLSTLTSLVIAAAMTATSVGITARVLADLGRLDEPESQIILGAAVIDDVVGLVILTIVSAFARGEEVTALGVISAAGIAFGFLAGSLIIGKMVVPPFVKFAARLKIPGTVAIFAVVLAFAFAWLASVSGSAVIIGAFAAGLLLADSPQVREIEKGVTKLGHFFVPLFFVSIGAAVDVRVLNPFVAANHSTLAIAGLLIVVAVIGKFVAAYAPYWFKGNKRIIGVGMIPRGEVGLIFAQMGLQAGAFDPALFSAVTLTVMATTFIAPPLLKALYRGAPSRPRDSEPQGVQDLVTDS